jgi:hypothetical protein
MQAYITTIILSFEQKPFFISKDAIQVHNEYIRENT